MSCKSSSSESVIEGATLQEARTKAYEAVDWVGFENKYMRHDIGKAIEEV